MSRSRWYRVLSSILGFVAITNKWRRTLSAKISGINEERFKRGEWWKRLCWAKAKRKVYCPYPDEEIVDAVATLKEYFDDTWAAELAANPRKNLVFSNLCTGKSSGCIGFAVYL